MNLIIIKKKMAFCIHKIVKLIKSIKFIEEINCNIYTTLYQALKIQKCSHNKAIKKIGIVLENKVFFEAVHEL